MSERDETPYTPTPEEIAAECERIQAEWTPEQRRLRRVGRPRWRPRVYRLADGVPDDEAE